jgi:uncharacterized cupredoxin-like copper-binding protein
VNRALTVLALIGILGALSGCASTTASQGASTLEGGIKLPTRTVSSTVHVTLSDTKGAGGPMSLTLSPSAVPAGDVTFVVTNTGTIEHEAVVLKTDTPFDTLPITFAGDPPAPVASGGDKVGEDANVGETGDPNLKPGETRTFTVKKMTPGNYAVVCNLAGHYGAGMRAGLTVTSASTSIVNVTLSDTKGAGSPMSLTLSPSAVPAGDVTFVVTNKGTIEHEAVVLKTDVPFDQLPITYAGDPPAKVATGGDKVGEDANVGETGDPNLKPGETRTFTVKKMTPGNYAVVCNLAGHYAAGMTAALTVTTPGSAVVHVTLSDTRGAGPMSLSLSPSTVPAGDVTFVVTNAGTIEHEAVVLKTNTPFDTLPITFGGDPPAPVASGGDKVGEDANVGETGDPNLQPGEVRTFAIRNMAPGGYAVVCNLAGHYGAGMRAALTVTPPTVHVTLSDARGARGPMSLTLSPSTVPPGDVTFVVRNDGSIEHEAVVLKADVAFDKLPITFSGDPPAPVASGGDKVGEDANVGETGDPNLKPGDTRTFTIKNMVAGNYVVVCNLAGHYGAGMRAALTVG